MSLLTQASLVVTPNANKSGKLYSVIPSNGNGDFTVTRATTATRTNSSGLIETTASGMVRRDYSLGSCPNLLLEPQRTNLFLNSVFAGSGASPTSWAQVVGTGTSVLTTSNLGTGAQALSQSATLQRPFISQNITLLANTTYSYSIYIESVSNALSNESILVVTNPPIGSVITYYSNGVLVLGSAMAVTGRLSILISVSVTGGNTAFRCGIGCSGNSTGTLLFSRPQLEAGNYSTSYIPTTTASVTRNVDVMSLSNVYTNNLITASGGTWFVELRNNIARTRDGAMTGLSLDTTSGSFTNGFNIRNTGGNARLNISSWQGGVGASLYTTTTDTTKIAIKWNGATADIFANGVKVVSATAFTPTAMQFLNATAISGIPYNINQMALFPTPLTDTQCTQLTTL